MFRGLSPAAQAELAASAQEHRFSNRQPIFREDDPIRFVDVIASGSVKTTQLSQSGGEVILRVDRAGSAIDGMAETPARVHTTSAYAIQECCVLSWHVERFAEFARRYPVIQRNAAEILAGRLKKLEQRFCDASTARVPQRLARVLLDIAGDGGGSQQESLGLSREELAQIAGTSAFTVSRLLREWAELDIVFVDRKGVTIEQLPQLMKLAELDDSAPSRVGLRARATSAS